MAIVYVTPFAPSTASLVDGQSSAMMGGKSAEGVVTELHGKWYTSAYRGRVFHGATAIGGITIPVQSTTAATFLLYNPVGSGVNAELIALDLAMIGTTSVVGSIMLATSVQTPTGITQITATISSGLVQGAATGNQVKLASAATVVAMTQFWPLFNITSTADAAVATHYDFDGKIILPPGACAQLVSNPVQSQAMVPSIDWAEYPI